jgi:hypothetical protein
VWLAPKTGADVPVHGQTVVGAIRALQALHPDLPPETRAQTKLLTDLHRRVAALTVYSVVSRTVPSDRGDWQACLQDDLIVVCWPEPLDRIAHACGLSHLPLFGRDCNLTGTVAAERLGPPTTYTATALNIAQP